MKKILMIVLFVFCLPTAGKTQINLALNPSFEQYTHCPDEWDEAKYCDHWSGLDTIWSPPDWAHAPYGVPDYENSCSSIIYVTIPNNYYFHQYARNGNGMMQVQMAGGSSTDPQQRDYLQGHLLRTLISGRKYHVSFYTISEQASPFSCNHIGAYLDDGTLDTTRSVGFPQNQYTPQIEDTNVITDTLNWHKIEGTFIANGTEKLITIGNFYDQAHTTTVYLHTTITWLSYYLIDDVSVIDCDNMPYAGNDTLIHPGDSAFLGTQEQVEIFKWYVLGGTAPIDSTGGIMVHPAVTTSYVVEQYLCGVKSWDTVKVHVWPDTLVAPIDSSKLNVYSANQQFNYLAMYPNPATQYLTIVGAKGNTINIFDVVGQYVAGTTVAGDQEVLDVSRLAKGVYLVEITDPVTGYKLVKRVLKE